MPRLARVAPGGLVYHVINRANGRLKLFKKPEDFIAFNNVLLAAHQRLPIEIFGWTVMSNHFHFLLRPRRTGDLSSFMRWLTLTHTQRWKQAHNAVGHGHLYQGRFKSFPVQDDANFLTVLRYIERNPKRAQRVKRAENWQWGSCAVRREKKNALAEVLSDPVVDLPRNWIALVNEPQTQEEEAAVQESIKRSRPFGDRAWTARMVKKLNLQWTIRSRGRQKGWRKKG